MRLSEKRTLCAALFGTLLGALVFFLIHTAAPLDFAEDGWIMRGYVERDIIQHYTGWLFYRDARIPFPLGVASGIGYPAGGAIAFSDSIPVMSVLFGAFSRVLPSTFQFFGLYTLLCYMLTGMSAAMLISLFSVSPYTILFGTLLFILSPVMTERAFRHTALASHFLLLFALYLYFLNRKRGFKFRWGYAVLCILAVAIHFYFVPMLCAILLADLLQDAATTKFKIKHLAFLLLNLGVIILTAFSIGYFHRPTQPTGALGYGYFTMNLNALVNPSSVSGIRWSLFLPALGQGLGSAEGFNYLGLGVILVLAAAGVYYIVRFSKGEFFSLIKRHRALFIICVLLTLYAISTTVVINNNAYIKIPLPLPVLKIFSIFRSGGRLFWPCYYLLLLYAVVFLTGKLLKKTLPFALGALLLIQIIDLTPSLIHKREAFVNPGQGFANPADDAFFQENTGAYGEVFTFSDSGLPLGLYFAHYAVENGMKTNEPFMARNDAAAYRTGCENEYERLMDGVIDEGKIYLFSGEVADQTPTDVNRFFNAAIRLGDLAFCGSLDFSGHTYYIVAPKNENAVVPSDSNILPLQELPLTFAAYSDLSWTDGVLNEDKSVVTFYDNAFTAQYLDTAEYILADGQKLKILSKDYGDEGWVIIRLDTADASVYAYTALKTE